MGSSELREGIPFLISKTKVCQLWEVVNFSLVEAVCTRHCGWMRIFRLLLLLLLLVPFTGYSKVVVGANFSSPLVFSGSAGWIVGEGDPAETSVPMLEAEIGYGGGRLLAGMDCSGQALGFGVKAALLYTWFEPIDVEEDQLYLGAELQGSVGMLLGSLGGYFNIDGDDDSFITTLLLGIRF